MNCEIIKFHYVSKCITFPEYCPRLVALLQSISTQLLRHSSDQMSYPSFYLPWDDLKVTVPLPSPYQQWESIAQDLQIHLQNKTLRLSVLELPMFTTKHLTSRHEWQRAYLILSILGQAYIWSLDEPVLDRIPLNISVPWSFIASKLGTKPVITYAAVEFLNYTILDPSKPLTLE